MRSTLIIASMALAILAAPVPAPEDQAPSRRNMNDPTGPIEMLMDKRCQRLSDDVSAASGPIRHISRSTEEEDEDGEKLETPQLNARILRPQDRRSMEDGDEVKGVEKRTIRPQTPRSGVDEEEVEKRHGRPFSNNKRATRGTDVDENGSIGRSVDDEEEVEERSVREQSGQNNPRSEEDNDEVEKLNDNDKRTARLRGGKGGINETRGWRKNSKRGVKETRTHRGPGDRSGNPRNNKRGAKGKTEERGKKGN